MADVYPDTFFMPLKEHVALLSLGDRVKLGFEINTPIPEMEWVGGERMWVRLTSISDDGFVGTLTNDPVFIRGLAYGSKVIFEARHILNLDVHADEKMEAAWRLGLLHLGDPEEAGTAH